MRKLSHLIMVICCSVHCLIVWENNDQDDSGRNDFIAAKVARDKENLCFYGETADPITDPTGTGWMTLLLDVDRDKGTGWEGYEYAANRRTPVGSEASVERSEREWRWSEVGKATLRVAGDRMEVCIPRKLLGLAPNSPLDLEFKWIDSVPASGDIMGFYLHGDVAPGAASTIATVLRDTFMQVADIFDIKLPGNADVIINQGDQR